MVCNLCGSSEFNCGSLFEDKPEMFYIPGRDYCPSCWYQFKSIKDPCYIEYLTRSNQTYLLNKKIDQKYILKIHIFLVKNNFPQSTVHYSNGDNVIDS